jgi:hypothetical protein
VGEVVIRRFAFGRTTGRIQLFHLGPFRAIAAAVYVIAGVQNEHDNGRKNGQEMAP